ncbi:MAG: type II toxin-antitoxin system VapC family toxin [Deltaproteobacteria bacterium]|nr:type II toxin-antitoxin system VapC family toxin [Deltaproteobacteria bacterium]
MWAADTNVIVRLLVSDDRKQQRAVVRRLEEASRSGESVLVPDVVLAELSWVLDAAYGYERAQIADAIDLLSTSSPFVLESSEAVREAIRLYREGPADLADYLILCRAERLGATALVTFDRKLARHPFCQAP